MFETAEQTCDLCRCGRVSPYVERGRPLFARAIGVTAQLLFCDDCRHKHWWPAPPEQALHVLYDGSYFSHDDRKVHGDFYKLDYFTPADQFFQTLTALGFARSARVHEFGCGSGLNVHHLRRIGYAATGSDWSLDAIEFARSHGNLAVSREHPGLDVLGGQRVDVVLSHHVIEHVPDPVAMLRWLGQQITHDGVILLRCPNGDSAVNRKLGMIADCLFFYPHHLHYFSPQSLVAAGEAAGLKLVAIGSTLSGDPDLMSAAGYDSAAAAMPDLASTELEAVFANAASTRTAAIAPASTSEACEAEPAFDWDSHAGFYDRDPVWNYRLAGADLWPIAEMVWSEKENYWYQGRSFIGDQWLAHYAGETAPLLEFTAPGNGDFQFEIVGCQRHARHTGATLAITLNGMEMRGFYFDDRVPRRQSFVVSLAKNDRVGFVCRNTRPVEQKTTLMVGVRRLGAETPVRVRCS